MATPRYCNPRDHLMWVCGSCAVMLRNRRADAIETYRRARVGLVVFSPTPGPTRSPSVSPTTPAPTSPGATLAPTPTPTAATPSTATPSTVTPSTAAPSTATPSTAAPSTAAPSTAVPSTATPSTATLSPTASTTAKPGYGFFDGFGVREARVTGRLRMQQRVAELRHTELGHAEHGHTAHSSAQQSDAEHYCNT